MATIDELVAQYKEDPALRAEVESIISDGNVTVKEIMDFARRHDVKISMTQLPKIISMAKEFGLNVK